MATTHDLRPHTPWRRLIGVGACLAVAVTLITLAFTWPTVTSEAKDLPIALAGPAAATAPFGQGLEQRAPGVFDVATVTDRSAAVDLIETREVYGAVVLRRRPRSRPRLRAARSWRSSWRRSRPCSPSRWVRRCRSPTSSRSARVTRVERSSD